jgi:hypothetical protein
LQRGTSKWPSHSTQVSASIPNWLGEGEIARVGHSYSHAPQLMHSIEIM